jgi:type II secretory pathway pseudopilin PulG
VAQSSSYQDNCCLLISSYSAPSMNATQLLLFPDPDHNRAAPAGYYWPYDGSEGLGGQGSAVSKGLGEAPAGLRSPASLAGFIVGLVVAATLAAVLLWVLLLSRQRRRAAAAAAAEAEYYAQDSKRRLSMGDVGRNSDGSGGMYGSSYGNDSSKDRYPMGRGLGPDGRPVADVAAVGSAAVLDQSGLGFSPQGHFQGSPGWRSSPQSGSNTNSGSGMGLPGSSGLQRSSFDPGNSSSGGGMASGPAGAGSAASNMLGNKRWQKLTTAISSKVHDIHQQRLRTALMQSQPRGSGSMGSGMGLGGTFGGLGATSLTRAAAAGGGHSGSGNYGSGSSLQGSGGLPGSYDSSSALQARAEGAAGRAQQQQQQQGEQEDQSADSQNVLELKELIGRGTFGTVYRWAEKPNPLFCFSAACFGLMRRGHILMWGQHVVSCEGGRLKQLRCSCHVAATLLASVSQRTAAFLKLDRYNCFTVVSGLCAKLLQFPPRHSNTNTPRLRPPPPPFRPFPNPQHTGRPGRVSTLQ